MKINLKDTTYRDLCRISELLGADDLRNLDQKIDEVCTPKIGVDLWQLTVADFGLLCRGEMPDMLKTIFHDDVPACDYISAKKALERFIENFGKTLEKYTVKPTSEERQAANGLPEWNENEGLLVFVRNYFGLHSFSEAEKITLADVYLAKKDVYLHTIMQRRIDELIKRKYIRK